MQCVSSRAPLPAALRPPGQRGSPRPPFGLGRESTPPPPPDFWPGDTKCQHWAGPECQAAISRRLEHLGLAPPPPAPARCPRPRSPAVLAGGALGRALGRGALRGALPMGAFAQTLEHGRKGGCRRRLGSAGVGRWRAAGVCPRWLLGWALVRWGGRAPGRRFLGGPSPQVRQRASVGRGCRARTRTAHTRPLLHNQFGEERAQPRGRGARARRLPEKVRTCYTHTPRGNRQRSHPDGERAGPQRDRAADGQRPGHQAIRHAPTHSSHPAPAEGAPLPVTTTGQPQGALTPDNWHKVHFKSGHHPVGSPDDNPTVPLPDLPGWLSVILSVAVGSSEESQTSSGGAGMPPAPLAPGPPALASRCC